MGSENDRDYVKRLEAALLEYVEKFGPTEAAKAAFREAPRVARTAEGLVSTANQSPINEEDPTD